MAATNISNPCRWETSMICMQSDCNLTSPCMCVCVFLIRTKCGFGNPPCVCLSPSTVSVTASGSHKPMWGGAEKVQHGVVEIKIKAEFEDGCGPRWGDESRWGRCHRSPASTAILCLLAILFRSTENFTGVYRWGKYTFFPLMFHLSRKTDSRVFSSSAAVQKKLPPDTKWVDFNTQESAVCILLLHTADLFKLWMSLGS